MTTNKTTTATENRDLVLTRIIDAPRDKVFKAWTDPALLKQWFAPMPWRTPMVETDVRAGGSSLIIMRSPEGKEFPNRGVYLEVVQNERLVFTDAFAKAWQPSEKPFMAVTLTFEDQDGQTNYTARVQHWTIADREAHEKIGLPPRLVYVYRTARCTRCETVMEMAHSMKNAATTERSASGATSRPCESRSTDTPYRSTVPVMGGRFMVELDTDPREVTDAAAPHG
jgi:uncharacterized protein YndB with AHSA1/START domain